MKIAIFHNALDTVGGAEVVALTLAQELNADLYSTVADQEKIEQMGFDIKVKTIGWIPKNAPFRQQLASLRFRFLNLSKKYDFFIIAGDWALSGAVKNKPTLWYVHGPAGELWDLYDYVREHIIQNSPISRLKTPLFDLWVKINRYLSRKYVRHLSVIVSNSAETQHRVMTHFMKDSVILYPPIQTSRFTYKKNGDFWLSVNRLCHHKRVEMQIEAFKKLPDEKLVIVGPSESSLHIHVYETQLKQMMPTNVTLLQEVSAEKLTELYSTCKGFITTATNESFGMTPIEAMASGKPVIAPNEGGYKETIIDGVTGKLINNIDAQNLSEAIISVGESPEKYKDECINLAKQFDTSVFMQKIKSKICL